MRYFNILSVLLITSCNKVESIVSDTVIQPRNITEQTQIITPTATNQGAIKGLFYGCGYNYILNKNKLLLYSPNGREVNQIETILSYSGLSQNFDIYSAPIDNAVATTINNRRYIIYDPRLLGFADKNSNSYWSSMSILAHEIGHHLQGHTLNNGGVAPELELQADKFSGHTLYKMGASLEQAIAAINKFGSETDSDTHPSKYKRIVAIKSGWESASKQRFNSAIPPPPPDDKNFGIDGYVKDEFFPDELISVNLAQSLGYATIDGTEPLIEGIVLEAAGMESEFSLTLLVTNDARVTEDYKYAFSKNKKVSLFIPEPGNGNISSADLSWLEALLVPGRKIAFKASSYGLGASGNGSWSLIYIKKLKR